MIIKAKNIKGFTLLEVLIAMAIFTVAISGLVVIFLSIVQTQSKILQMQNVMNQSSYAMEYVGNALRLAMKDTSGSCVGTANLDYFYQNGASALIRFLNYDGKCRQFSLSGTAIQEQWSSDGTSANLAAAVPVTSSAVEILNFGFAVTGDSVGLQPRITIMMKVDPVSTLANPPAPIIIQTSMSQRQLNINQ